MNHLEELQKLTKKGICPHLVYDDRCHWAATDASMNQVGQKPEAFTVFVEKKAWKRTPQKAIEAYLKAGGEK